MSDNHHVNYKRVYLWLLALLVVSVAGPFIGILSVTLITAFGIAVVKANLVIQNFMHLRWEKTLAKWVLIHVAGPDGALRRWCSPRRHASRGPELGERGAADAVERGVVDEHAREEELAEEETDVAFAEPGVFDAVANST